jgi:hypothetical protein
MPKLIDTEKFIERAILKHGARYDYSICQYKSMNVKVQIKCLIHGIFLQTPDAHLRSGGCARCAYDFTRYAKTRHTTDQFIQKAKNIHGSRYDYTESTYIGDDKNITIRCKIHGIFSTKATSHLQGNGCQKCVKKYHRTTQEFINEAHHTHNNKYDYSATTFINTKTDVIIICTSHGAFKQHPLVHLGGGECPRCRKRSYSKKALQWLTHIEKQGVKIQHAGNIGEYVIPSTRLAVDGFCKETNTIYEFYGDLYHGNPQRYDDSFKPYSSFKYTARELLTKTLKREKLLQSLGYIIITIWESEWDEKTKKKRHDDRHTLGKEIK